MKESFILTLPAVLTGRVRLTGAQLSNCHHSGASRHKDVGSWGRDLFGIKLVSNSLFGLSSDLGHVMYIGFSI